MAIMLNFDDYLVGIQSEQQKNKLSYANQSIIDITTKQLSVLPHSSYLLDYSLNKYPFVSKSLQIYSQCDSETLMQMGLEYTRELWHPDDWKTNSLYIFPTILNFLKNEPINKWHLFEIIFNYRVRTSNKLVQPEYTMLTQKSRYLNLLKNNLPYLSTGIIDHSSLASDCNLMYLRILYNNKEVYRQTFISIDKTINDLTAVEQKILKYRTLGYSYEEISQKLNNAVGTVSNHLKNIKSKTNCFTQDQLKMLAIQFDL